MEGRRRQKWDRSQNRRPHRGNWVLIERMKAKCGNELVERACYLKLGHALCSGLPRFFLDDNSVCYPIGNWQPTIPWWEKEFCRVIGSLDWETLLQMKKYIHLYENVINWDDSAGKEAFSNAKKRFWAELNGLPCDISLPGPDLCIDKIDWDSEIDPNLLPDLVSKPFNSNQDEDQGHVVTFGDSLFQGQAYSATGWGNDDENFQVPANSSSGNQPLQNWCSSFESGVAIGWPSPSYYNNGWQFGDGNLNHMAWGGGWNDWGWSYSGNNVMYEEQLDTDHIAGDRDLRVQDKDLYLNTHHAAIAVGQAWNQ